jgi:hypothetical protein
VNSNKKVGRIVGVLFLLIFILGVIIYQFLQGPILFADNFLAIASYSADQIIISTLLGILSGVTSIVVAAILLPIFKRHSYNLAFMYFAFCILCFIAICIDNISVLSMLELSQEYVKSAADKADVLNTMGIIFYEKHWWTHYLSLLISSFPVFILYVTLYLSRLIPRAISIFGIIAVILMFIEILFSLLGHGISMNMLLPLGLVQLILPFWLIFKGLNSSIENRSQVA